MSLRLVFFCLYVYFIYLYIYTHIQAVLPPTHLQNGLKDEKLLTFCKSDVMMLQQPAT